MENNNNGPLNKKMDDDKDDATKSSSNAAKKSAAEVNRGGNPNSKNYMNKEDAGREGPDFNKKSKGSDGGSGQNAGVFK